MSTKPLTGFVHVTDKEGKVRVVKRPPRMAAGQKRNQAMKANREEKAWRAKSKSP